MQRRTLPVQNRLLPPTERAAGELERRFVTAWVGFMEKLESYRESKQLRQEKERCDRCGCWNTRNGHRPQTDLRLAKAPCCAHSGPKAITVGSKHGNHPLRSLQQETGRSGIHPPVD